MSKIVQITPDFAVAGQLDADDIARAAQAGFKTIINNRPDGEERGQPTAAEGQDSARTAEVAYVYLPTTKHDIFTEETVGRMAAALAEADGPVLAHCKSGQRSAVLWAAASARNLPVEQVLAALASAGLDFSFLRDELDRQHDFKRWAEPQPVAGQRAEPARDVAAA